MTTPTTSSASAADEPPLYRESINVNECYVCWGKQQPHQNDLSFCCDVKLTNPFRSLDLVPTQFYVEYQAGSSLENNVKGMICAADLECWYTSLFARPPNVLSPPIFPSTGNLGLTLATQPMPNFLGYTSVRFDIESIMAADMKNFQFALPMPVDFTGSSYQ
uniref:Late embryogenesis abundant protein LEA-2 subgroup domain-containing protein n=1 Tax=Romanomermis culicivorax TaxID=13658 RepID=A0A915JF40_ROMCU